MVSVLTVMAAVLEIVSTVGPWFRRERAPSVLLRRSAAAARVACCFVAVAHIAGRIVVEGQRSQAAPAYANMTPRAIQTAYNWLRRCRGEAAQVAPPAPRFFVVELHRRA